METAVYKSERAELNIKERVLNIAHQAGDKILEYYGNKSFDIASKEDDTPLTDADLASHSIIYHGLSEFFPYPILSEEKPVAFEQRKSWQRYWLVDPLDGTRDFIARDDEFCINIALIQDGRPVFGLIYIPVSGVAYIAAKGQGAFRVEQNGDEFLLRNTRNDPDLISATSRFHSSREVEKFCKEHGIAEIYPCGSAIKFCRLAEGLVDVYPRLTPCSEWDIAAGHLLVTEAGCSIKQFSSKLEPGYNKKSLKMEPFAAWRQGLNLF